MLADKQYKALRVLRENPGITAMRFAALYYTEPTQQYLCFSTQDETEILIL